MKKDTKNNSYAIAILPYLFLHEEDGLEFDGLKLKSSYDSVLKNEKKQVKNQLVNIASIFSKDENQINQWSYIVFELYSKQGWLNIKFKIDKFINLLKFIKFKDLDKDTRFNQFDYFVFEINSHELKQEKNFHYIGVLNGESEYRFLFKDSKIINRYNQNVDIYTKIIYKEQLLKKIYFRSFYSSQKVLFSNEEERKILKSIEWFNRSFSHYGRGLDSSESIINMQTALEALLRSKSEKNDSKSVKVEIETALMNLLGHSSELSDWFNEYWKLRNSIVHGDVGTKNFGYIHRDSKTNTAHRSHLYCVRKVYILCFDAIFQLRSSFPMIGFSDELKSNEVKINAVIKEFTSNSKKTIEEYYKNNVFNVIDSLRSDDISSSKESTKKMGDLLLGLLKENVEDKEVSVKIDEILNFKTNDLGEFAIKYSELQSVFSPIYFNTSLETEKLALYSSVYHFLGHATWRLLAFNY